MRRHKTIVMALLAIALAVPTLLFGHETIRRMGNPASQTETICRTVGLAQQEAPADRTKPSKAVAPNAKAPAAAPAAQAPGFHTDLDLLVCSYYNDNTRKHPKGMYRLNGEGTFSYIKNTSEIRPTAGAWIIGDEYHTYRSYISQGTFYAEHAAYDMTDWSEINEQYEAFDGTGYATAVAYNPADGLVYGCFGDDKGVNSYSFAKLDVAAHQKTAILPLEYKHEWVAMFFDENNTLYVIDGYGYLFTVDLANGDMDMVNHTGQYPQYSAGIGYDPRGKRAYWAISTDDDGYLTELNPKTGVAEKIFSFTYNDELTGICVIQPKTADATPQMVSNLKANFADGSLSGTVSFTMPAATVAGDAISGSLDYRVMLNGVEAAAGTAESGAAVNAQITAPAHDFYDIAVYASNAAGDNVPDIVSVYIGHDAPRHPDNVTVDRVGDAFAVAWDAPTKSHYSGYVDYAQITYTVTRMPDGAIVAENIAETSISDAVAVPGDMIKYQYEVQAIYDGHASTPGLSNVYALGAITPPYLETFDTEDNLIGWTVLNVNDDGVLEWQWKDREGNGLVYIPCNWQWSMDDWLISPPVRLEGGKTYEVSFDAWTGDMTESFEFFMGTEPTVKGMTQTVIPVTSFYALNPTPFISVVTPETTGNYYFGIHGVSPAYTYWINFDNFAVSAPLAAGAPGEVSDIRIVPDVAGGLSATVSFKAPSKNYNGTSTLESLSRIEVTRDGQIIKTFENPAVGAELSFVDAVDKEGGYVYGFTPYTVDGHGQTASASAYIGINYPGAPSNLVGYETDKIGEVKLTWEAPLLDINDYPINPDWVTYNIVEIAGNDYIDIASGVSDLSYTFQAVAPETPQSFKQYGVISVTAKGEGYGLATGPVITGAPDNTPYVESFRNGTTQHVFGYEYLTNGQVVWSIVKDTSLGISDSNGDHGCVIMNSGKKYNETSRLYSGRVKLNLQSPELSFYTYNFGDMLSPDNNEIEIAISTDGGRTYETIDKVVVSQLGAPSKSWAKVSVNIAKYVGESVIFGITGTTRNYGQIYIDNIEIKEGLGHDVGLTNVKAPAQAKINEKYNVTMSLVNNGSEAAQGVSVCLFRNGVPYSEQKGFDLGVGENREIVFADMLLPVDGEVEYSAVANYSADEYENNNYSATVKVTPFISYAPMVTDLALADENGAYSLSWQVPELPETQTITDDFESYEPWTTAIGDWTTVDADGANTGTISSISLPISGPQSFWVMDGSDIAFSEVASVFAAHSGDKYLSQMYPIDIYNNPSIPANDWLISPELSGDAQTVTFFARSVTTSNPDQFELLYSTDGVDIDGFTMIERVTDVTNVWTEYSFAIPAGAKHFAIRCNTPKGFMFFVDDITYSIKPGYEIKGYNVYRNGVKITDAPVAATSFVDASHKGGEYGVSVVYASEESKAAIVSAPLSIGDAAIAGISVKVEGNELVITAKEPTPVSVYGIDGCMISSIASAEYVRIPVRPGLYLVKVSSQTFKVIVE